MSRTLAAVPPFDADVSLRHPAYVRESGASVRLGLAGGRNSLQGIFRRLSSQTSCAFRFHRFRLSPQHRHAHNPLQDYLIIRCTIDHPLYRANSDLDERRLPMLGNICKALFEDGTASDIRFLFAADSPSASTRSIIASKTILMTGSSYFRTSTFRSPLFFSPPRTDAPLHCILAVFSLGFAESSQARIAKYSGVPSDIPRPAGIDENDDDTLEWLPEEPAAPATRSTRSSTGKQASEGPPEDGKTVVEIKDFGCVVFLFTSSSTNKGLFAATPPTAQCSTTSTPKPSTSPLPPQTTSSSSTRKPQTNLLFPPAASSSSPKRRRESPQPSNRRRPHAIYRLADKIDMGELKELAKKAILGGFSVENARLLFFLSSRSSCG